MFQALSPPNAAIVHYGLTIRHFKHFSVTKSLHNIFMTRWKHLYANSVNITGIIIILHLSWLEDFTLPQKTTFPRSQCNYIRFRWRQAAQRADELLGPVGRIAAAVIFPAHFSWDFPHHGFKRREKLGLPFLLIPPQALLRNTCLISCSGKLASNPSILRRRHPGLL